MMFEFFWEGNFLLPMFRCVLIVKASTGLDSTTCTKSELVAST